MTSFDRPVVHPPAEAFLARLLFAAVVLRCTHLKIPYAGQPYPNGLAHVFDLTLFSSPLAMGVLLAVLAVACLVYVAGRFMIGATGVMLFALVVTGTLANSQGAIIHARQIVALVALGQFIAYLSGARRSGMAPEARLRRPGDHDLALHYSKQAIASAYVVAGVTKLIKSGGSWIADAPNLALQVVKTNDQHAYSFIGDSAVGAMDPWASMIAAHPNLSRIFFGGGLLLELGAFLALAGRRAAFAVGIGLLAMHASVAWLMKLHFINNQLVLGIFLVGVPNLLVMAARWLRSRFGTGEPDRLISTPDALS